MIEAERHTDPKITGAHSMVWYMLAIACAMLMGVGVGSAHALSTAEGGVGTSEGLCLTLLPVGRQSSVNSDGMKISATRFTPDDAKEPVRQVIEVRDAVNREPVEGVWISCTSCLEADSVETDSVGIGVIELPQSAIDTIGFTTLAFSHPAYNLLVHSYVARENVGDTLHVMITPIARVVKGVVVEGQRSEYSTLNNPAVHLIDRIVKNLQAQRSAPGEEYTYRKYDRLTLSMANFDLNSKRLHKLFPFFNQYVMPSKLDGRMVLPFSVRERLSDMGMNPVTKKKSEVIRFSRHLGLEQNIDDGTLTKRLEELFPEINIFDDDIKLLSARFVSPLSSKGNHFYKYYITDTIISSGEVCEMVAFYPHNPQSMCFTGQMLVSMDDDPQVLRCEISIPKHINLNFVHDLRITQNFRKVRPGKYMITEEEMAMTTSLYHNMLSLYCEHRRTYDSYNFENPDPEVTRNENRVTNLANKPEAKMYEQEFDRGSIIASNEGLKKFLEEVRRVRHYKVMLDLGEMLSRGYVRTRYNDDRVFGGSLFDVGPISTFIGRNEIENLRLRLGGRTTGYLSPYLFLSGYLAYGFGDKRFKYHTSTTVSFNKKRYYLDEFPKHDLTLTREYDLFTPGQIFNNDDKDNILYNIGTSYLTNRSYRDTWKLTYRRDWANGFSVQAYGSAVTDIPTGSLNYVRVNRDSTMTYLDRLHNTTVGITLRYAPGERIYEGNLRKREIMKLQRDVPIFMLSHQLSLKVLGGDFFFNRTEFSVQQRLWLSAYGNIDYRFVLGKIWNNVPFPLLYSPPANRAFAYNEFSYQLLLPMEYIGDEYANAFVSYHLRGLIFNRIPLIKRLHLRGVLSVNALYGNMSKVNSADYSNELFVLPNRSTEMHLMPYVEVGFGLENIFRVFRIDVYKRVTKPGPFSGPDIGVKGQLRFDF